MHLEIQSDSNAFRLWLVGMINTMLIQLWYSGVAVCSDPGTPAGATLTANNDGFYINATVTFTCSRDGFGFNATNLSTMTLKCISTDGGVTANWTMATPSECEGSIPRYTVKPVCNDHLYSKNLLAVIYSVMFFNEDWRYQFTLANNFCLLELI